MIYVYELLKGMFRVETSRGSRILGCSLWIYEKSPKLRIDAILSFGFMRNRHTAAASGIDTARFAILSFGFTRNRRTAAAS